jgi:hypothetical protein
MSDAGHGGVPHSLFQLVEMMAKSLYETNLRALALSRLLVDHSVISGEELNALMREMDEVNGPRRGIQRQARTRGVARVTTKAATDRR